MSEKPKKSFRDSMQAILFHPKMRTTLEISNGILDVIHKMNGMLTNPLIVIPAVGSAVSVLKKAIAPEGVWSTIKAMGLKEVDSDLGVILQNSALMDGMGSTLLSKDDWSELFRVEPEAGQVFYLLRNTKYAGGSIYTVNGDDSPVRALLRNLFRIIGGMGIELTKADGRGGISMKTIPMLFTDHDLTKVLAFANEIHECRQNGDSPAFVCLGKPGVGKTTFCLSTAQLMGQSVVLIGPQCVASITGKALMEFVSALQPGFLIIDDVDKAGSDNLGVFYTSLNNLRSLFPKMCCISTTNVELGAGSPIAEAFLRPGRGGELKNFPRPTLEDKAKLLVQHGLPAHLDATLLAPLIEAEVTHDWVRSMANKIARRPGSTFESAREIIKEINGNFLLVSNLKSTGGEEWPVVAAELPATKTDKVASPPRSKYRQKKRGARGVK